MNMIVVEGFRAGPGRQKYECLKCGHVEQPGMLAGPAAE